MSAGQVSISKYAIGVGLINGSIVHDIVPLNATDEILKRCFKVDILGVGILGVDILGS